MRLCFLLVFLFVLPIVHAHPINLDYAKIMTYDNFAAVQINVPHSLGFVDPSQMRVVSDYIDRNFWFENDGRPCAVHVVNYSSDFTRAEISLLVQCREGLGRIKVTDTMLFDIYPLMEHEVLLLHGNLSRRYVLTLSDRSFEQDLDGGVWDSAPASLPEHDSLVEGRSLLGTKLKSYIDGMGRDGSWPVLALLVAFLLGALHSLGPGHGKAYAAAYLVGQKRSMKHALLLGSTMTVTHVLDVVLVSVVALFFSGLVDHSSFISVLRDVAAVGIIAMGVFMLYRALNPSRRHVHDHSGKQTVLAGVIGGLAPCPTAWVVFLSILALDRLAFGILVLLAFSLGLALTITSVGVVVVKAAGLLDRGERFGSIVRFLPFVSSAAVILLGSLMLLRVV